MPTPIASVGQEAIKEDLRGLVRRTVEDTLNGLLEEEAAYRRRAVRFCRNVPAKVPKSKRAEAAAMLKAIHAMEPRGPAGRRRSRWPPGWRG